MGKRGKKISLVLTRQSGAKNFAVNRHLLIQLSHPHYAKSFNFLENSQPHLACFDIIKLIVVELQDIYGVK